MSKKIIITLFATLAFAFGITACQPKDSNDNVNTRDNSAVTDTNANDSARTTDADNVAE